MMRIRLVEEDNWYMELVAKSIEVSPKTKETRMPLILETHYTSSDNENNYINNPVIYDFVLLFTPDGKIEALGCNLDNNEEQLNAFYSTIYTAIMKYFCELYNAVYYIYDIIRPYIKLYLKGNGPEISFGIRQKTDKSINIKNLQLKSTCSAEENLRIKITSRGVGCNQKVIKSNQNALDMKTARTVDFSTNSGYPRSGEGGI